MKANEFVKKFGWDAAKKMVENNKHTGRTLSPSELELKRMVESHELIEKAGGLNVAYYLASRTYFPLSDFMVRFEQAIADVESCQ